MWLKKQLNRSRNDAPVDLTRLKKIVYRGGLITFLIPEQWAEEYVEDGGGIFYWDSEDSSTLRVNVLTFSAPDESAMIDVDLETKRKAANVNGNARKLDNGNALVFYDQESVEDGHEIILRYWEVYNVVASNNLRIAVFSYTLLKSQFNQQHFINEIEMLDREIGNVLFAPNLGII